MCADVADVLWTNCTLLQRLLHGAHCAFAIRVCGRHVMGIARQAITTNLSIDARTASFCRRQRLEHNHSGSLARYHSLSVTIKRLADFRCDCAELSKSCVGDT